MSALSSARLPTDAVARARLARARIGRVPARLRQTLPGDSTVNPEGWTRSRRADGRGDDDGGGHLDDEALLHRQPVELREHDLGERARDVLLLELREEQRVERPRRVREL